MSIDLFNPQGSSEGSFVQVPDELHRIPSNSFLPMAIHIQRKVVRLSAILNMLDDKKLSVCSIERQVQVL